MLITNGPVNPLNEVISFFILRQTSTALKGFMGPIAFDVQCHHPGHHHALGWAQGIKYFIFG